MSDNSTRSLFDDDPEPAPKPAPKRKRRTRAQIAADKAAEATEAAEDEGGQEEEAAPEPSSTGAEQSQDAPGEKKPSRRRRKPPTAEEAAQSVEDMFESASPSPIQGPLPQMRDGFLVIIDRVHNLPHPEKEYEELVSALELKDELTPIAIRAALNASQKRALAAYRLFRVAKSEHEAFANECSVFESALRDAATHELQAEKTAGLRAKAITDADVIGCIAHSYPDAWRDLNDRKIKAQGTLRQLERFADLWKGRCRSLEAMLFEV